MNYPQLWGARWILALAAATAAAFLAFTPPAMRGAKPDNNKGGNGKGHDGMHVKSTAVTDFHPNPNVPDCRVISCNVMIDGVAGTAIVDAWDRGEPGRNDFFSFRLSTGYSARGTLGGEGPGGGNLQLHKCPPGWE